MAVNGESPLALPFEPKTVLVQLHVSEYSALTTRATYSAVLCTALWGLAVAFLTFVAAAAQSVIHKLPLIWLSTIAIEVIFWWILGLISDQYVMVLYMETTLRPLAARHLQIDEDFWKWERFLNKRRGDMAQFLWEWGMNALVAIALVGQLIWRLAYRVGFSHWDWLLVPSLALFFALCRLSKAAGQTRREWSLWNERHERVSAQ